MGAKIIHVFIHHSVVLLSKILGSLAPTEQLYMITPLTKDCMPKSVTVRVKY